MRLAEMSSALIGEFTRKLRRRSLAGLVVLMCVVAAAIEAVSAARHALEPVVGPVGSRLIIMAGFLAVAAVTVGALVWAERRHGYIAAKTGTDEDPRAAIIAEAVSVGYSLGREFMKASPEDDAAAGDADRAAASAADSPRSPAGA